jgi:L-aminopeptidase/D-esterase-like protein
MDPTIELFWRRFRKWDVTSERLKSANDGWKRRVIVLTLAGTAFGALAPFSGVEGGSPWPPRVLGIVGTVCLALATYFAKELLDSGAHILALSETQGFGSEPAQNPAPRNTTIGVVVTDAALTVEEANIIAVMAHDGIARATRPS